ncbi:MAG: tetratricopeptide repeat protein [Deltaproteobacteria bacterium]|nr:tetratricopeptide repeat protein [Deltaproteobacteria bacterium]
MIRRINRWALSICLCVGGIAQADERDTAKQLLDEGNRLFRAGDTDGAITKYAGAYAAYPSPKLLYNLARAQKKAGRLTDAAESFERFLGTAEPAEKGIPEAKAELEEIDGQLARLQFVGPQGFSIRLDGSLIGTLPMNPVRVVPGRHEVGFEKSGTALASKTVTAAAKVQLTVEVEVDAPTPQPSTEPTLAASHVISDPSKAPSTALRADPNADEVTITENPWFWGAVLVVVAGSAVAIGVASGSTSTAEPELGASRFKDWAK